MDEEINNEFGNNGKVIKDGDEWIITVNDIEIERISELKEKTAILQGREFGWQGNLCKVLNDDSAMRNITGIIHSTSKPSDEILNNPNHLWSIAESETPVYFWVNNNVIYYWSEADTIFLNTDSSYMFHYYVNLQDISGLKDFDASNVTYANRMFGNAEKLSDLDPIKHWNVKNVTNMSEMFASCYGLVSVSELSNWNVSNVENMSLMFMLCTNLTDIDLTNWNTENVTNMGSMFNSDTNLTTIYASENFVISQITNLNDVMFGGCNSLEGGLGTKYSEIAQTQNPTPITYAHIDGGTSNPGYFTAK